MFAPLNLGFFAGLALAVEPALEEGLLPGPPVAPAPAETHVAALPNVGFDTDDGLGFGARVEVTRVGEGYAPYLASYVIQAYATLEGYHHHRVRIDLPYVGEQDHRVTAHLAYRQWLHDGYWGLGNQRPRDGRVVDAQEQGRLTDYYRYTLIQPFSHLTLRTPLGGPWSVFEALDLKYSEVRTLGASSLLAEEQPFGMDGGFSATAFAGVLFDTREPEVTPRGGVLLELSGRASVGQHHANYLGIFASARGYVGLGGRVVVAGRVMGEQLVGQVPFYDMVQWGGLTPVGGFGGAETIRGLAYGRYHGQAKVVGNAELRIDVVRHSLFRRSMLWEIVPFADTGFVRQPGEDLSVGLGPVLHHGVGGGVRAIFDETLVGRVDIARARDPVLDVDKQDMVPMWGIYLVFDHMF